MTKPIHVPFLEDSVRLLARSLNIYRSQEMLSEPDRDPFEIAAAIRDTYLAVEKLLKHIVAKVDPHLPIKKPEPAMLQNLRRDLLEQSAPSLFASRQWFESFDAKATLKIITDVLRPKVAERETQEFSAALEALAHSRNRAQHGELYDMSDALLLKMSRTLGALLTIVDTVSPEFLPKLREVDDAAVSTLRAIQKAIDGAWQILRDYLDEFGELKVKGDVFIVLEEATANLRWLAAPPINSETKIAPGDASGFFLRPVSADQARHFEVGHAGLLFTPSPPKMGLVPLEPGEFQTKPGLGFWTPELTRKKGRSLGVGVILLVFKVSFEQDNPEGKVVGVLGSQRIRKQEDLDRSGAIDVKGTARLMSEYVGWYPPAGEEPPAPDAKQATYRYLQCELVLSNQRAAS